MSIQVTLTIPEEVYRRAKRITRSTRREVADVLAEAITLEETPPETNPSVEREAQAFRRLHPALQREYVGQFVAIHNEALIDHDWDQVALFLRAKARFPAEFVWIAPVGETAEEIYHIYSPRLLRDGE